MGVFMALMTVVLAGCHRNYKVVHVRVPVDSMAHDDGVEETVEEQSLEPLIDIPDMPQEEDFKKIGSKGRKEYDNYIKGR